MPDRAPVALADILEGMEFQSEEVTMYLHLPTGRILPISDEALEAVEAGDDPVAEWQEAEFAEVRAFLAAEHEYLALPDRVEINEYEMMRGFARSIGRDADREALLRALQGRGAFRYFKDRVAELGLRDAWYRYRDARYEEVALEWCESVGVVLRPKTADA